MMMLNKDKKFENFNLKSSRGNEDSDEEKVEAHGVHKSWVFRIQTNVENFEKIEKCFPFIWVRKTARKTVRGGPSGIKKCPNFSGNLYRIALSSILSRRVKMKGLAFLVRPLWNFFNRSQTPLHILFSISSFPKIYGIWALFGPYFRGY